MSPEHGGAGGSHRAPVPDREAALECRLRALATDLDDEPAPGFRAATRARLVAMAAVRSPAPAPRRLCRLIPRGPARLWRARLTAGLAGAALTVTALGALVALATDAQPGDALYGLKRGTEQTRLALAGDERGLTLLGFASTRLQELDELVEGPPGTPPADLVRDTLATMDAQTEEGAALVFSRAVDAGDAATLTVLSGWAQEQRSGLSELEQALPADTGTAAGHSLGLVTEVGTRAGDLQAVLECPTGPATTGNDELGPLPAPSCETPATPPPSPAPPSAGTPDPTPPTADQPSGAPDPTPGSGASAPTSAAPSGDGGADSSAAPTGGSTPAQTSSAAVPGGEQPDPSDPPPDGTGSSPTSPAPAPGGPSGPVLDTPLPLCLPPVVC
ncbi:DUF5667 domain-containing protein [Geodermatophilus sp. URMC 62]|uniref:DUF5667 domain-containing protein n=1 Tax=Geodermatophilus sp. URMC 62 TaxID=3423414 RepID=UPI00406C31F0